MILHRFFNQFPKRRDAIGGFHESMQAIINTSNPITKRKGKDDFSTNPKANKVFLIGSDRNFRKKTDSLQ